MVNTNLTRVSCHLYLEMYFKIVHRRCVVRRFLSIFFVLVTAFLKVVHDFWSLLFSGAGAEKLLKFKKWFWSIVEKMSNSDRQDLVSVFGIAIVHPLRCLISASGEFFDRIVQSPRRSSKYSDVRLISTFFSAFGNVFKHSLSCSIYYMKHSRRIVFVLTWGFK